MNAPPSFPTKRSRLVRDAIFGLAIVAWVGAMYALQRENRARALTERESDEIAVFTDAFEQNLKINVRLKVAGVTLEGVAVRRTKEPWDGRLIVRERARVAGSLMGTPIRFERDVETSWDRGAGGLRRIALRFRITVPGMPRTTVNATARRSRDPRTGDMLLLRTDAPGFDPRRVTPIPIRNGSDLSAGFMGPAQIRPVRVGVRWEERTVDPISQATVVALVEVVEKGNIEVAGVPTTAYRAVTKIRKDTGRDVEAAVTWYDSAGRALVQTLRMSALELTLERAERLAASDVEFEKLAIPGSTPEDDDEDKEKASEPEDASTDPSADDTQDAPPGGADE